MDLRRGQKGLNHADHLFYHVHKSFPNRGNLSAYSLSLPLKSGPLPNIPPISQVMTRETGEVVPLHPYYTGAVTRAPLPAFCAPHCSHTRGITYYERSSLLSQTGASTHLSPHMFSQKNIFPPWSQKESNCLVALATYPHPLSQNWGSFSLHSLCLFPNQSNHLMFHTYHSAQTGAKLHSPISTPWPGQSHVPHASHS